MKSHVALACACAIACSTARTAAAETVALADLSLEQLMDLKIESVYGASRYEQRVTQAPSSISIVTAEEIRRFGYASFADVLRGVRGLYVADDRNYEYLGIRGFHRPGDYNTRVLVLIDGHRLNDNVYDSGAIGRDAMIDVGLIERVEVIRGPSSSVYGSSAFFGVINVITKEGAHIDGIELTQEAASFDTYATRATYGTTFSNGTDWIASASHYSSHGEDELYYSEFDERLSDNSRAANQGLAIGLEDEEATKFFTSLRSGGLHATAYHSERRKQVPTASWESIFGDPDNRTRDERSYVDVAYGGTVGTGWQYLARGFYDQLRYDGWVPLDYALPGDPPDRVVFRDEATGEWVGGEVHISGQLSSRYRLVAGAEYRANLREDQLAYDDLDPRVYYVQKFSSSTIFGAFAQLEASLRDDFTITAGLRYDQYSADIGSTLNPRVAIIYNPSARSAVKLLYGEAFRAPNPYERYYFSETQLTQAPLESETISTYELVYEHYLGNEYHLNLSTYHYEIDGLITQSFTEWDLGYYDNIEAARATGVEIELEGRYANGLIARTSYVLQRTRDVASGDELSSSPRRLAKLNVSVPLFGQALYSNLEVQYNSSSFTLSGAKNRSFVLTHLGVTTSKLWKDVELSATVRNLFDVDHGYPGAQEHEQDTLLLNGRTYQGKLVVRF